MKEVDRNPSAIGMLGGSFDPIHNGHIYLAESARKAVSLDKVIFIPALIPPHKTTRKITDSVHRLNMMRLAITDCEWISIDENEIQRGGISYTVDTLRDLSKTYPEKALYFIIGSDSLHELWTWRNIREIAARVTFITLRRDGDQQPFSCSKLDSMLKDTQLRSIQLKDAPLSISSTLIRERVAKGLPIKDLVPEAVERYIKEQALYQEI